MTLAKHADLPTRPMGDQASTQTQGSDESGAAAEHDWLATLNLVRRASRQVRQTDAAAKSLARNAEAFIHYANQIFDDGSGTITAKPSVVVLAGVAGVAASWLALLWFIFAEDPLLGLKTSSPAVTRHHLISLAQCALLTAMAAVIVGVLHRGFRALTAFYEAVLKRSAQHESRPVPAPEPSSTPACDRRQVVREGLLGGRPYVLFSNGTDDLEIVFGVRSFDSLEEAREFVGEAQPAF